MLKKLISAYITFAILLIIFPNPSLAEEPLVEWIVGDSYFSYYGGRIAVDSNGDVYKTTYYNGLSNTVKYDTDGNQLWTRDFQVDVSASLRNSAVNIALDSSGNVYINAGSYGVIKYNKDGVQQWTRKYGNYGSSSSLAMAVDDDGNVYVSGRVSTYDKTVKYDTYGNIIWEADNNASNEARALAVDQKGNVYVAIGQYGSVIIKFDATGNRLWTRSYGSDLYWARGLSLDTSGNVHVIGVNWAKNMVTIKISTDGIELWKNLYNGPSSDWGNDITVDEQGNVYVAGQASPDFITIKYNSSGTELWANKLIVEGNGGNAITLDSKGNVYTSGYNRSDGGVIATTVKYDNCGNEIWVDTQGSVRTAVANMVDKEDNLYVLGVDYRLIKYGHDLENNSSCGSTDDGSTDDGSTDDGSTGDGSTGDVVSFDSLLISIDKMIETSCINNKGIANAIQTSLNNAMESDNEKASLNMLEALINKISAQTGKDICSDGAEKFIVNINKVILQ